LKHDQLYVQIISTAAQRARSLSLSLSLNVTQLKPRPATHLAAQQLNDKLQIPIQVHKQEVQLSLRNRTSAAHYTEG